MSNYYLSKFFSESELQSDANFWCGEGLDRLVEQKPEAATWQAILQLVLRLAPGECGAALDKAALRLKTWPADLRKLSSHWGPLLENGSLSPALKLAGSLEFHRHEQGASFLLGRLAESPMVGSLERLSFNRCDISDATFQKFFQSPHFTQITDLHIHNSDLGKEALSSLLEAPFFPQLRRLQLSKMGLDKGFCTALHDRSEPALQYLNLNGNRLGAGCALALLSSDILPEGATLSMQNSAVQASDHSDLSQAASRKNITLLL